MAKEKKILHTTERGLSENGFCVLNGKIDKKKTSHSTNKRVVVIIIIVDLRSTRHTAYFKSTLPKKKKIQSTYTNQTQYYMFNKLINKLNQTKKKMKNEIQC